MEEYQVWVIGLDDQLAEAMVGIILDSNVRKDYIFIPRDFRDLEEAVRLYDKDPSATLVILERSYVRGESSTERVIKNLEAIASKKKISPPSYLVLGTVDKEIVASYLRGISFSYLLMPFEIFDLEKTLDKIVESYRSRRDQGK